MKLGKYNKPKILPAFKIVNNKIKVLLPKEFKIKDYLILPSTLN